MRARRAVSSAAWLGLAWLVGSACQRAGPDTGSAADSAAKPAAGAARTQGSAMSTGGAAGELLAVVDTVLLARHLAPGESLAVLLVGSVGPSGAYGLQRIEVERQPGRTVLVPRVQRQEGGFFIQMVVPLDEIVRLTLEPGPQVVTVRHQGGSWSDSVLVAPGTARQPPRTEARAGQPIEVGAQVVVPIDIMAQAGDGFVQRIEVRQVVGQDAGVWQPPETFERRGARVQASFTVQRPAGDPPRRIEVRAVDGQGAVEPQAAVVSLAAR
jgi:hypothetical protein